MKRLLLVVAGLILLAVVVLAVAPFLFGGAVETRVQAAIDRRVDARVEYGGIGLSLLRHFPDLAVTVDDLTVTGVGVFEGDTLAHTDRFRLVVALGSVIGMLRREEALVVREVLVGRPYLRARLLADGRASWDIEKAVAEVTAEEPGTERPVRVDLRRLEVEDGRVVYEDRGTGLEARFTGIQHTLAGDFSAERFTLEARAVAEAATIRHAGVPYLTEARVHVDADLDADMAERRYTFRQNRLSVNELGLTFDGTVELLDDGLGLDLTFAAADAGLRDLLSLVPAFFSADFDNLVAEGVVAVNGFARGQTGEGRVPSFALNASVADGRFRYTDLGTPFTDIELDLAVAQPASDPDSAMIELSRLSFTLGDDPFLASLVVATPVSDPEITASVDGAIDLDAAGRALKLEGVDGLGGRAVAELGLHARRSWIETGAYDRVDARGRVALSGVVVAGEAIRQPVAVDTLDLALSPRRADLTVARARVGSSDFEGSARLENLLGYALHEGVLAGRAELRSGYVALDEWKREEPSGLEVIPIPADLDLALDVAIDSMSLGRLAMTGTRGSVQVRDQRATLTDLSVEILGGDLLLDGWYETADATPAFQLDLAVADVRIPAAFETMGTVRALAPAAGYATGSFSADLALAAPLTTDLAPVLAALDGEGGIRTRDLAIRGMPALEALADVLGVTALRDPAVSDFAASIHIDDGRLHVRPFTLRLGPAAVAVAGSNGVDGSLDYDLDLELPRELLGSDAASIVSGLKERADRAGLTLDDIAAVGITADIGGTFRDPRVSVELADALTAAGQDLAEQARTRLQDEAGRQADEAQARVEAARLRAAEDARARADSIIAAAERQAVRIRAAADSAARSIRTAADRQADRLVAEASNPVARRAAETAGARLRREADRRAIQLTETADRRAEGVVSEARETAARVLETAGIEPSPTDTTVAPPADTGVAPSPGDTGIVAPGDAGVMVPPVERDGAAIRGSPAPPVGDPRGVMDYLEAEGSASRGPMKAARPVR